MVTTTNTALSITGSGGNNSSHFENLTQGTFNFAGDGSIVAVNYSYFDNWGLVRKSAGTGNSVISATFNNWGGTIEVDSGQVTLAGGGTSSNGTFNVAAGAVLDLTGNSANTTYWSGLMTNTGPGLVELDGTINVNQALTLDFVGTPFLWNGTLYRASGPITNLGLVSVAGATLEDSTFYNLGLVHDHQYGLKYHRQRRQ